VNEVGKFQRVSNEEDGSVVAYEVVVAFFGVELDCKPAGITFRVC
jgi:hypothetical protein